MPSLSLERQQKLLLLQNLLLLQKRLLRNLESHCLMNNSVLQKCSSVWSYYKKTGNCSLLYPHDQVAIISISDSVLLWKSFKLFCFVSYIDMFYIMQFYFFFNLIYAEQERIRITLPFNSYVVLQVQACFSFLCTFKVHFIFSIGIYHRNTKHWYGTTIEIPNLDGHWPPLLKFSCPFFSSSDCWVQILVFCLFFQTIFLHGVLHNPFSGTRNLQ